MRINLSRISWSSKVFIKINTDIGKDLAQKTNIWSIKKSSAPSNTINARYDASRKKTEKDSKM